MLAGMSLALVIPCSARNMRRSRDELEHPCCTSLDAGFGKAVSCFVPFCQTCSPETSNAASQLSPNCLNPNEISNLAIQYHTSASPHQKQIDIRRSYRIRGGHYEACIVRIRIAASHLGLLPTAIPSATNVSTVRYADLP